MFIFLFLKGYTDIAKVLICFNKTKDLHLILRNSVYYGCCFGKLANSFAAAVKPFSAWG